jgi:hypothetical protein
MDLYIENVFLFSHWKLLLLKSRVITFEIPDDPV